MDSIPEDVIFQFHKDTFQSVRKDYNLEKPGVLNQCIDSLEEWVKKQDHFVKKDFPREYLERMIIACKGSVERAKSKLDRACTLKTLMPAFYETINFKTNYKDSNALMGALLPKLTDEHYRIYLLKVTGNQFDNGFTNYFRFLVSIAEYFWAYDYCRGITIVVDFLDANMLELIRNLDFTEVRQIITLLIESYGIRIVGIHAITTSKAIETLITFCKQIISAKIFGRIQIHKDLESLHNVVPKDILPVEQGGNERSLKEIHEEWLNVLSSSEHQEYFNKMKEAVINEKYIQTDKFNDGYMGIAGTFKTINVD